MYRCKNLKFSQVAPANFVYRKYSLDFALDSLEKLGAKKIEFYAAYPHFCLDDICYADMKLLKRKIREHHLMVDSFCPENCFYPINIASFDVNARERSIEYYIKGIETASELECPHCQFLPGFQLFDEPESDAWKRGVESMRYVADLAYSYGCDVVIEASPSYWAFIDTTPKTMQFIKEVDSPGLNGLIDTVCIQMMGETIDFAMNEMGVEHVGHVHFSDAVDLENNGNWDNRILGEGSMDMEHTLEVFDQASYPGTFGLEIFAPYEYDPEKAMKHQIEWCKERFIDDNN